MKNVMDRMEGEKTLNTHSRATLYNTKGRKSKVGKSVAAQKKKQAKSRKQLVDTRPCCTSKSALLMSLCINVSKGA